MISNISAVIPFTVGDVISIAALLAAVFVAIRGCRIILGVILFEHEYGVVHDDGRYDDVDDWSAGSTDEGLGLSEEDNPLGKSIY